MKERGLNPWLADLRASLVEQARRRVEPGAVEDVVQDTLRVIVERGVREPGGAWVDGLPPLAWSMQVLRNMIGNHYQRARVRSARWSPVEEAASIPSAGGTPLELYEVAEGERIVRMAIERVAGSDPNCGRYLERLAGGAAPGDLAEKEGVDAAAFYRRLYRCREKLRTRLREAGVVA